MSAINATHGYMIPAQFAAAQTRALSAAVQAVSETTRAESSEDPADVTLGNPEELAEESASPKPVGVHFIYTLCMHNGRWSAKRAPQLADTLFSCMINCRI